ncbi:MAG: hypothetical protein FWD97_07480 [Defluviitaleaceae bacterium]|nr:hypothetical protein [Defluviitaleaceae bacterium]
MKRIFLGLALVLVFAMTGCEGTTNYPQVNIPEQIDTTSQNGSEHTPTLDLIPNVFDVATLITLPYDKELLVTSITPLLASFIPTQDTVEIRLENVGSDLGWLVSFDATSDPMSLKLMLAKLLSITWRAWRAKYSLYK